MFAFFEKLTEQGDLGPKMTVVTSYNHYLAIIHARSDGRIRVEKVNRRAMAFYTDSQDDASSAF